MTPAYAQSVELDEVQVVGFRASLASALETKRADNTLIDVIKAEDFADFPDLNLAEALQRVPGVAIDRDGGEGRSITVRGLSGDFSRVRLNGFEALATTGGKDGSGGANRGRGFDFQVFASDLFDNVSVRKSQSAELEEGSLGATIDLNTPRPLDHPGPNLAASVQYGYNDLSKAWDPRATVLASNSWMDGKLGALISLAYSARRIDEEGSSSGRWESPAVPTNSAGCFQTPGPCNSPAGVYSAVNSAWHARLPRYGRLSYDWQRYGATSSIQFAPTDDTKLTLDGMFALVDGTRHENYLEVISLTRGSRGAAAVDVRDPVFDSQNQLVKATFDDMDARSEDRFDVLTSEFSQLSLNLDQNFGDRLTLHARIAQSRSIQDNPVQTTATFDRYDTDNYVYDFSASQKLPLLSYGFDVANPANWSFSPTQTVGDASLIRMRPNKTLNRFKSAGLDLVWEVNDDLTLKVGGAYKDYRFVTAEWRRNTIGGIVDGAVALPGISLESVSHLVTDFGSGLGMPAGTPRTWLAPDVQRLASLLDINCNCINSFGDFRLSTDNQRSANRDVSEQDSGVYLQADFNTRLFDIPLRGNVGLRQTNTTSEARGFVGTSYVSVTRKYDDLLPALNLVLEPRPDLLVRMAAAKVMSRPQLPFLTPGGSLSNTAKTLTIGNPLLDPIRGKTYDLSLEWYPAPEVQVSVSAFYKDLQSYIQSSATTVPFRSTGLPTSLLSNGNDADTIFLVTQLLNTDGGALKGYEVALQGPFRFLPAPFDRFGGLVNFTWVDSEVTYITDSGTRPPSTATMALAGLSPISWNGTLYYEGVKTSARVSLAYRDGYITAVPGGNGNDARGKNETLNVDVAATYRIGERTSLTFEGLNLTDQFEDRWISSTRRNSEEYTHTGRQFLVGARYRF